MPSAGRNAISTTEMEIYDGNCAAFFVGVPNSSTNGVLVNIPGIHDTGDWFPLGVGDGMVFRMGFRGIRTVVVKGDGGAATVNYGVVAVAPATKMVGR